jgi:hypothetical protein
LSDELLEEVVERRFGFRVGVSGEGVSGKEVTFSSEPPLECLLDVGF